MKKLFALLTVIALSSAIAANAAESQLQNFVNKKLAPLTQKEQELNSKIEAQKKADAAKRAEWEKKQAEQEKAAKAREYKHMTFQEAAKLGREANPREMWLTHYSPSLMRPEEYLNEVREIFPKIKTARDGWSMELGFDED